MPDYLILMGLGGLFVILGIGSMFWGKGEWKSYYNNISTRADVREYLEREPERPEPGALKIGGWIFIAVGLLMIVMGVAFWLWD